MNEPGAELAATPLPPSVRERLRAGGWYFAVAVLSGGFLAAIPFWHAANRLGRPEIRRLASVYTLAGVYLVVLGALTPPPLPDGSSGNETVSSIGAMSVVFLVIVACVQLRPLRREVYGGGGAVPAHRGLAHVDPALTRVLAARDRREQTRRLVAGDPALRRELGIGRPDLGRGYDDGGLVDLNTAPAQVIADVCDIEPVHAEAIVAGRLARGGTFFNVGEVLVDVPLPPHVQDQLRERAIF